MGFFLSLLDSKAGMWIQDTHFLFLFFSSVGNIFRHQLWKCWNRHVKMHNLPLPPWETACYHMHWNAGILAGWLPQTSPDTTWEEQLLPVNCALLGGHLRPSPSSASVGGQTQPPWGAASACVSAEGAARGVWGVRASHASSSRAQSPVPSAIPPCPEEVTWGTPVVALTETGTRGKWQVEVGWLHVVPVCGKEGQGGGEGEALVRD